MALNLSQKQEVVAELADVASKAHSLVAAEYAGTTVSQMTAMRKKARETGVFLKVVKNTLATRAVTGTEFEHAQRLPRCGRQSPQVAYQRRARAHEFVHALQIATRALGHRIGRSEAVQQFVLHAPRQLHHCTRSSAP